MRKVEAQRSQVQNQPTQRQGGGAALESPQGERIAQLEAMAEASSQVSGVERFAAMANGSPQAAAQRRTTDMIHDGLRMAVSGQERHLPHKAWHVVQQAQGRVKPTMQMKDGIPVNDDAGLEREADAMGGRALQMMQGQWTRLACVSVGNAPVQRLKLSEQFGLSKEKHLELISKIDAFHEARSKHGDGKLGGDADGFEDLLKEIRRLAEAMDSEEVAGVIDDVEEELRYLDENNSLRTPVGEVHGEVGSKEEEIPSLTDEISDLSIWIPKDRLGEGDKPKVSEFIQMLSEELGADLALVGEIVDKLWQSGELSSNYAEVRRLIRPVVGLAQRIVSIGNSGIRPRGTLEESSKVQSSSDVGVGRGVSHYFDIQRGRNSGDYEERFPYPGMSSASVASERFNDRIETAGWAINLARNGHKDALQILARYGDSIGDKNSIEVFIDRVTSNIELLKGLGNWIRNADRASPEKRFLRLLATGRSHYTAMFASTGPALEKSYPGSLVGKKGLAPDVRELESSNPMPANALTHVIVPELMGICDKYLQSALKLKIIYVPTKVARNFSFFDAEIQGSVQPGDVLVPDYDSAIDKLTSTGGAVLTHITRGPA